MNLPNKLTMLRIILVPVFVVFMLWQTLQSHYIWALLVFAAASFTDMLDGRIARSRSLVTDFGKLMDPLADKILTMSAMLCFVELGYAPSYVVIIILAREFLVTSMRLIAAGKGVVIAADIMGKAKTVITMLWIITLLIWLSLCSLSVVSIEADILDTIYNISYALMIAAAVLTIMSGGNYVIKNRALFMEDM